MATTLSRAVISLIILSFSAPAWADEAHWIDVRTAEEFAASHVEMASNIPYQEITARIDEITRDKDDLIYVYCRSGRRSGIARQALMDAGYSNVVNMGGLEDARNKAEAEADE